MSVIKARKDSTEHKDADTVTTPAEQGAKSSSGHMPAPESDDDTLANAQETGLYTDRDERAGSPPPISAADEVEEAEEALRE